MNITENWVKVHEVGRVYREGSEYFLLIADTNANKFAFVNMVDGELASTWYDSLEELDENNLTDVLIEPLIVMQEPAREVVYSAVPESTQI